METRRGHGWSVTRLKTRSTSKPRSSSWQSFRKAPPQLKNKGAGMDYVAPHLYQWLPREPQWDLYIAVHHVWESGDVPHHWLPARIAMIYKSILSTTVPLSTNASYTACVGKSHFASYGLAPRDRGKTQ